MKYAHIVEPNGDKIIKTLLCIRERMGDKWGQNMAEYAIKKAWSIPPLKYRVMCGNVQYQHIQFVEV